MSAQPASGGGPIAIVFAMPEEAEATRALLGAPWRKSGPIRVAERRSDRSHVLCAVSGMGKVAAALASQWLCCEFAVSRLYSWGIAGGLRVDSGTGDVVVGTDVIDHDFDVSAISAETGAGIRASPELVDELSEATHALRAALGQEIRITRSLVLSGDRVVADAADREDLVTRFPGAASVDMETAAVAHIASANNIPWASLRVISDRADSDFHWPSVLTFCEELASPLLARVVQRLWL